MSRILFMGAPYEVAQRESRPLEQRFAATGHNTGNLLIGNGLYKQLRYDHLEPYRYAMTAEYAQEHFDRVVIAAANFLFPGFDFTKLSDFLGTIDLPVTMIGLGAQLPSSTVDLGAIPTGTWRLVEIAAERSHSIGVRGATTADLLARRGIHNVQIVGCPSLYTTMQPTIRIKTRRPLERVVVNGSRNVTGHASDKQAAVAIERGLFKFARDHDFPYVLQNEQPEMQIVEGCPLGEYSAAIASVAKFFEVSQQEFVDFYRKNGRVFFSIDEWFEWITTRDFSIGTRFHGNVAALLNGVPAVILTHDSRTRELCEFAAIPCTDIESAGGLSVERLYENADYSVFEKNYGHIYSRYVHFLDENAIPHRLPNGTVP